MATINAVIVPAKALKGGRHKIRISVAHNGETRYIVTDIIIDSAKEFKNGVVVKRPDSAMLNTKLRGLLQRYQSAVDELAYANGLSCAELVFQMKSAGKDRHRTLGSLVEEYLENARIKPSTLEHYKSRWRRVSKCIEGKTLIESISPAVIMLTQNRLKKLSICATTMRGDIAFLRIILSYAKKCGYVQYGTDPFASINMPRAEVRDCWLSVGDVKAIRDLKLRKKSAIKARDIFMLSYYLGGINTADLCKINFNEQTDVIHYVRAKTENMPKLNKFVEFKIPEEAKEIIRLYKNADGYISMTDFQRMDNLHFFITYHLKKIAEMTGIRRLVYYSARKSFSQHAFEVGVPTCVIDYILGHKVDKGGTSLYNYISVTPDMATEAVRKVLDNLK